MAKQAHLFKQDMKIPSMMTTMVRSLLKILDLKFHASFLSTAAIFLSITKNKKKATSYQTREYRQLKLYGLYSINYYYVSSLNNYSNYLTEFPMEHHQIIQKQKLQYLQQQQQSPALNETLKLIQRDPPQNQYKWASKNNQFQQQTRNTLNIIEILLFQICSIQLKQ